MTLHTHLHCCYQCCLFARFTKKLVQMIAYHSLFFHFDRLKGLLVCNFISIPPKKVQINKFEIFYSVSTKLLKTPPLTILLKFAFIMLWKSKTYFIYIVYKICSVIYSNSSAIWHKLYSAAFFLLQQEKPHEWVWKIWIVMWFDLTIEGN